MQRFKGEFLGVLAIDQVRVHFFYKFASLTNRYLGLAEVNVQNQKVLNRLGVDAQNFGVTKETEIRDHLVEYQKAGTKPITHIVICAPWVTTDFLVQLIQEFPKVQFTVNCHSNFAFLMVDTLGIRHLKEQLGLQASSSNFNVAGNSEKFCTSLKKAYGHDVTLLPNLYCLQSSKSPQPIHKDIGGVLRIGAFGATRIQKNLPSAAAAALIIGRQLKKDVEFYITSGSDDKSVIGMLIVGAIWEMYENVPTAKFMKKPWTKWSDFRTNIGSMHLVMQPSYTESFNYVAADAVAEGICCVGSTAINWLPDSWKADPDDAEDIAKVGLNLLHNPHSPTDGMNALKEHVSQAIVYWHEWLTGKSRAYTLFPGSRL